MRLTSEQRQLIRQARNLARREELGVGKTAIQRKSLQLPVRAFEAARERQAVPRTAEEDGLLALSVALDHVKPMDAKKVHIVEDLEPALKEPPPTMCKSKEEQHPLTEDNVYYAKDGSRRCCECRRKAKRRYGDRIRRRLGRPRREKVRTLVA